MSDFAPDARPAFTKFKARRNIAKGFKWDSDKGKLVKTAHGQLFDGEAKRLTLKSAAELVDLLVNNTPREALCWGVSPYDDAFVTTANKLPNEVQPNGKKPTIARTRDFFSYPKQPGVMMFDVDPPKDGSAAPLTLDQSVSTLVDCCPPADKTPMVCACSSSSHVWCNGEEKMGDRGFHVYLFVQDASDIPRAGKVMFMRSWLKGYGRIEIGRAGQLLERSFIDGAVWQPERLDFGMKAHCVPPVEQRQPRPLTINTGGPFLDTRAALPDLTPTEETEFKRLVARAKKDREAQAAPIREAWAKDRARDILRKRKTTPEAEPGEFKRLVDSLRSASSSLTLDEDIILHTPHGATVTVGEIMADPEKWRGQRFADPLEPDYGGDPRIAYLSEKGGKWGIYSHAHGGVRYALPGQRQAEPEPEMSDYQKVTENYQSDAPPTGNPFDSCLNVAELLEVEPPAMQWFAKERVPQGRGIILTGVGGVSKSTMLKQLGFAAVLGRAPWSWEFERTGKALLMLTEDTQDDAHTSLRDIADAMQLTPAEKRELASGLVIRPFAGEDSILMRKDERGRLCRSDLYGQLLAKVKAMGNCVFVGIDPALAVSEGDELDQQNQRALAKMADDLAVNTGATVMLVTHGGKALINADEVSSHSSRGGGAVTDGARGEYVLRSMTKDEAKRAGIEDAEERARMVQLVCSKGNRIPPSAKVPVWLRRGHGGVLSEVVLDMTTGATCTTAALDDKIFEVLLDIGSGGAAKLKEWQTACEARGVLPGNTSGTKGQNMKKAAARLRDARRVVSFTQGYYTPCNPEPDQEW